MPAPLSAYASPLFALTGKRILITGSNGGIGLSLARGFATHGAKVVLNGRDADKLQRAADSLRALGHPVEISRFDVTKEDEVTAAIATLTATGPLDILINNAGIGRRMPLEQLPLAVWNEVLATNLTSAFLVAQAVARTMIPRKNGKIINICSLMSEFTLPGRGPYAAAKGGLKMLTKSMCADWAHYNLQVNGIAPGYFSTDMTRVLANDPQFDAWVKRRTPAGRWGETSELLGAAIFLSSEASAFVNGQVITVDGGMTAVL